MTPQLKNLETATKALIDFSSYVETESGELLDSHYDKLDWALHEGLTAKDYEKASEALELLKELADLAYDRLQNEGKSLLKKHNQTILKEIREDRAFKKFNS